MLLLQRAYVPIISTDAQRREKRFWYHAFPEQLRKDRPVIWTERPRSTRCGEEILHFVQDDKGQSDAGPERGSRKKCPLPSIVILNEVKDLSFSRTSLPDQRTFSAG